MSYDIEEKYVCPRCLRTYTVKANRDIAVEMSGAPDGTNYFMQDIVLFVCGCKKGGTTCFKCDPNMLEYIVKLNKEGYRTAYHCEGHEHIENLGMSLPYIMFKGIQEKIEKVLEDKEWKYWIAVRDGNRSQYTSIRVKEELFDNLESEDEFISLKWEYLDELKRIVRELTEEN